MSRGSIGHSANPHLQINKSEVCLTLIRCFKVLASKNHPPDRIPRPSVLMWAACAKAFVRCLHQLAYLPPLMVHYQMGLDSVTSFSNLRHPVDSLFGGTSIEPWLWITINRKDRLSLFMDFWVKSGILQHLIQSCPFRPYLMSSFY